MSPQLAQKCDSVRAGWPFDQTEVLPNTLSVGIHQQVEMEDLQRMAVFARVVQDFPQLPRA